MVCWVLHHPQHTAEAEQTVLVDAFSISLLFPRALDDLLYQAGEKGRTCTLCFWEAKGKSHLQSSWACTRRHGKGKTRGFLKSWFKSQNCTGVCHFFFSFMISRGCPLKARLEPTKTQPACLSTGILLLPLCLSALLLLRNFNQTATNPSPLRC